jgi:hypothetical protein
MTEPTITCPQCKAEIRLTESLAAPLLEATKRDFEQRLAQKEAVAVKRETALREREAALAKEKETLEEQVADKLKLERNKIVAEEARKAKLALSNDLEQKSKELLEIQNILKKKDEKLAEAQQAQADLLRKQRELDDAKRELDLTVEKRVQEGLTATRDQAKKEVEDALKFKVMEKEQTITSMQKQIEDLKRRAEQGSQQLQGEVQELELEALLTSKFPQDQIQPVAKGEYGGDVLHRVAGSFGQPCGTILWESKRTKNWSDGWLTKLREDQRQAKAEIAIIVSQALPKEVETFEFIDGVWVTHPKAALPVAIAMRHTLLEVASARQASEGQQTKMEMVYQYLMGPRFRAKREEQIGRVMQATVGMYGDLQGIAGKTLQEIEGLELRALDAPKENDEGKLF